MIKKIYRENDRDALGNCEGNHFNTVSGTNRRCESNNINPGVDVVYG
ncbi:MAG TPA: hypothetical protein VEC37_18775 [Bacillota bacterium]|nr:hypothetical protein [Bacillota bacterium]